MKVFITLILLLVLTSCLKEKDKPNWADLYTNWKTDSTIKQPPIEGKATHIMYGVRTGGNGLELQEYTIDGCQYLGRLQGHRADILTHKGNCTNHPKDTIRYIIEK